MKSWQSFFIGATVAASLPLVFFGGIFLLESGKFDPPSKMRLTKMRAQTIQSALTQYLQDCSHYPKSLENLIHKDPECKDWGPEPYLNELPKDGFDNSFLYTLSDSTYRLLSLGKDMREGGTELDMDIVSYETDFATKETPVDIPFSRKINLVSSACETDYETLRQAYRDFYFSVRKKILQTCNEDIERNSSFKAKQLKLNLSCQNQELTLSGNYKHKCQIPVTKTHSQISLHAEEKVSDTCDLSWDLISSEKQPNVAIEAGEKCQKGFREIKHHLTYKCSSGRLTAAINSNLLCAN